MKQNPDTTAQKKRSLLYRIATVALPALALLLAAAFVLLCVAYSRVRPVLTIELGEGTPQASAFSVNGADAAYVTQPEALYKTEIGRAHV